MNFITDIIECDLDESEQDNLQHQPNNTKLAFTKTNIHAKSIYFNTLTHTKISTPTKFIRFNQDQPDNILFQFSIPKLQDKPNNQQNDEASNNSQHSYTPQTLIPLRNRRK